MKNLGNILSSGFTADEKAGFIKDMINNCSFDPVRELASLENGTVAESKKFFWITYHFLMGMQKNYLEGNFDDRNEASCVMADKIIDSIPEGRDPVILADTSMYLEVVKVAEDLLLAHKTLQQTFAGMCFLYLEQYRDCRTYTPRNSLCEYARKTDDRNWWRMPLI